MRHWPRRKIVKRWPQRLKPSSTKATRRACFPRSTAPPRRSRPTAVNRMPKHCARKSGHSLINSRCSRSPPNKPIALSDLLDAFDQGRLRAPITGTISVVLAHRGAVVRAGDSLLELVGDHRFVVAWVPVGRWYKLDVGQQVSIDAGAGALPGMISRIGPVASALPREFQKAFTPTERLQLIWIEFERGVTPPPYFTKVRIY